MTAPELEAIWITLKLATITTIMLILIGTPIAWWLARSKHLLRSVIEPIVALPIVLPPTVLGFYLLLLFSPNNPLGAAWQSVFGTPLAFTFTALVLGSIVYSLPFYVQPLQLAFSNLSQDILDATDTLGANAWEKFFSVVMPNCRHGFLVATCLAFAHTVGEFGIVLMIGGNIPGETRVVSIALFDLVESLQYGRAHLLAAVLLIFSFCLLFVVYRFNRKLSP